ncbi:hypothetical protein BH10BAC5_BH10BAC5_14050 [soil metagenome]
MEKGKWESYFDASGNCPLNSGQEAVHMCIIYDENKSTWKILYFDAWKLEPADNSQYIRTRVFDMGDVGTRDRISAQNVPIWEVVNPPLELPRMYCAGHSFLEDGRPIVAGGHRPLDPLQVHWARGLKYTYIFNPIEKSWTQAKNIFGVLQPLLEGRWYPTLTKLEDNRILAIAGFKYEYKTPSSFELEYNPTMEIYSPQNGWELLPPEADTPQEFIDHNVLYPGGYLIPYPNDNISVKAGHILYTHPLKETYRFDPSLTETHIWLKICESLQFRASASSVMLALHPISTVMKFVIFGGASGDMEMPTDVIQELDLTPNTTNVNPGWTNKGTLNIPRRNANVTQLTDGKILITGGNQMHLRENAVTVAEMYDPETGNCEILPSTTFTRMYHSTAILLPDARVMISGGEQYVHLILE